MQSAADDRAILAKIEIWRPRLDSNQRPSA